jgi:hypothetical protein
MLVTLTSGSTTFDIANGASATLDVVSDDTWELTQQTQTTQRARADWLAAFPDRASRSIPLSYRVIMAPCASLAAAFEQARQLPAQCPKGGTLVELLGSTEITYASAWLDSIRVERMGVTNILTYQFTATDPAAATLSRLAQMDDRYLAVLKDIAGLTGGTSADLDSLTTTDVADGFTAFLPRLLIGSVATPKHFTLTTGTDAEQTDPTAGLLIVRPDDYHASTNAKVWKETL